MQDRPRPRPSADANFSNRQLGLFIQDDWAIDKQLELNLGVRWDYESNMLNNGYATPADRVAAAPPTASARASSPRAARPPNRWPWAASASTTTSAPATPRKAFRAPSLPRLGFSYDVTGDRNTVVFGGWGRSYDRTMANHALDELQKNKQSGGEIWLIRNDFKAALCRPAQRRRAPTVGDWNVKPPTAA